MRTQKNLCIHIYSTYINVHIHSYTIYIYILYKRKRSSEGSQCFMYTYIFYIHTRTYIHILYTRKYSSHQCLIPGEGSNVNTYSTYIHSSYIHIHTFIYYINANAAAIRVCYQARAQKNSNDSFASHSFEIHHLTSMASTPPFPLPCLLRPPL